MALYLYNTSSRKKEKFIPIDKNMVKIYSCGPTVYNYVHIGNLRTFLFADILVRYLRFKKYNVRHVMNITDVDDKTIKNSIQKKISLKEYTSHYEKEFLKDISILNIIPAYKYPKASEHINEMVFLIKELKDKKLAYYSDASIYFNIAKFKEYGKLSQLKQKQLKSNNRIYNDEYDKENIGDFVLWKSYKIEDGPVYWENSLGKGRPGWHIECSAMSMKHLGSKFDIHTGGVDNIFPHHENELAQSMGVTGIPLANYWLHSEFLNFSGEKISKSKGNVIYLKNLLQMGYSREVIRFSLIQFHYRSKIDYSKNILDQASTSLAKLNNFIDNVKQINNIKENMLSEPILNKYLHQFIKAMDDDLNISRALGFFFVSIKELNKNFDSLSKKDAKAIINYFKYINKILGIFNFNDENISINKKDSNTIQKNCNINNISFLIKEILLSKEKESIKFSKKIINKKLNKDELNKEIGKIIKLIFEREEAKKIKDYKKSDEIRNQIKKSKGILIEDTKEGFRIKNYN